MIQKPLFFKFAKLVFLVSSVAIFSAYTTERLNHRYSENPLPRKIIDMHTHVACLGNGSRVDGECYISPAMQQSYKFSVYLKSFGVTVSELQQSHDFVVFDRLAEKINSSTHVKASVVLAMDAAVDHVTGQIDWNETQVYVPNEFVLAGIKQQKPGLFYYGASINPYRKDAIARLEQAKNDGAVLIKWIPSTMNIDPSDPSLEAYYKKLVELHLPLLVHTGREQSFNDARDQFCDPALLKLPLNLGVTIIAAHMATTGEIKGEPDYDRLRELFKIEKYKGLLFADISATTQFNRVKGFSARVQDSLFQGRLLNGTDWPLIDTELYGFKLVPYKLYSSRLFGSVLSTAQVSELDSIPNTFDRDIRLKQFLGTPEAIFYEAEHVLNIQ